MNEYRIGDCLEVLRTLPDGFANTCVTSPPYWQLRNYGVTGQIGLEETPEAYVERMVEVFREVRRVLRDDGTLWLNLGDSYAGSWGNQGRKEGRGTQRPVNAGMKTTVSDGRYPSKKSKTGNIPRGSGLKPKDLVGIPWMVAFALRADGWYLRSDIIWHKTNPMPESIKDRPTKAHEYLFLLSKSARYYYDAAAIRVPCAAKTLSHKGKGRAAGKIESQDPLGNVASGNWTRANGPRIGNVLVNRKTIWACSSTSYVGEHMATYPPDLIKPCISAGCPEGGLVLDPFFGSGTTGMVAESLGRQWFGIELNPEYEHLIRERTSQRGLL